MEPRNAAAGAADIGARRRDANAWLHTKFRLDSLAHNGTIAYVSMHGEMNPESEPVCSQGAGPELETGR